MGLQSFQRRRHTSHAEQLTLMEDRNGRVQQLVVDRGAQADRRTGAALEGGDDLRPVAVVVQTAQLGTGDRLELMIGAATGVLPLCYMQVKSGDSLAACPLRTSVPS